MRSFSSQVEVHSVNGRPEAILIPNVSKSHLIDLKSAIENFLIQVEQKEKTHENYDEDEEDNKLASNPRSRSNNYYNDDLDMDQQSQEFWDNV